MNCSNYYCFRNLNPLEPWYHRSNMCAVIGRILMILGIIPAVILIVISPLTYSVGLLTQRILDGKIDDGYSYWDNIVFGIIGIIDLIAILMFLAVIVGVFYSLYILVKKAVLCCQNRYEERKQYMYDYYNQNPLLFV